MTSADHREDGKTQGHHLHVLYQQLGQLVEQGCDMIACCQACAPLLCHEISQGFFLNLLVTWLSSVARLSIAARSLSLRAYELYLDLFDHLAQPPSQGHIHLRKKVSRYLALTPVDLASRELAEEKEMTGSGGHSPLPQSSHLEDLGSSLGRFVPSAPAPGVSTEPPDSHKEARRAVLACEYSSSEDDEDHPSMTTTTNKRKEGSANGEPAIQDVGLLPVVIDRGGGVEEEVAVFGGSSSSSSPTSSKRTKEEEPVVAGPVNKKKKKMKSSGGMVGELNQDTLRARPRSDSKPTSGAGVKQPGYDSGACERCGKFLCQHCLIESSPSIVLGQALGFLLFLWWWW